MEELINQAEEVWRTWQPIWSSFISAPLREEAMRLMSPLNNIYWHSDGGYPGAERQRLLCIRYEDETLIPTESAPLKGIQIEGNFLFDRASTADMRHSLEAIGAPSKGIGDIWLLGDRGAQALCTPETAELLHESTNRVRDVEILCQVIEVEEVQFPPQRISKQLRTVEASTRLDAIASAGFGLSRAKIVNQIKDGRLRVNWQTTKQASKGLTVGDRIQLEERGALEVLNIALTKRNRWRIELLRH